MKRPSFQFYPADWRANAKLGRCTHAERGIWITVMCLLHDSEEQYGVLHWPLKDLAQAAGCKLADLKALREKRVLKGADAGEPFEGHVYTPRHAGKDGESVTLVPEQDGPIWFSSRMVEDEYIRNKRATLGGATNNPEVPIGAPSGSHPSRVARAQSSSSPSSITATSKALSGAAHSDAVGKSDDNPKAKARAEARAAGQRAIEYLNAKAGTKFRITEANLKFPVDRQLVDKASEDDLKAVVDAKIAEAAAGKFDRKYLRPETLWNATKFGSYVGQVGVSALSVVKSIHVAIDLKAGGGRRTVAEYTWSSSDFNAFELVIRTARNPTHRLQLCGADVEAVVVHVDKEQGIKGRWSPSEIREGLRKAA